MKKDITIQKNVMEELKWIPLLDANEIGVAVKNGIVTISGIVDSYPKKVKAERAVMKVAGVHGIANEIVVRLSDKDKKTDSEIAQVIWHELEWHSNLDIDRIKILVDAGSVTLEGNVGWDFQRKSATKAIRNIKGIREIINNIKISTRPVPAELKDKIESAFERRANLDAGKIKVEVQGSKVVLKGTVRSWTEKMDAEESVWSSPGVSTIENQLECWEEEEIF
jgi:osmotically-inducible protein OsmY